MALVNHPGAGYVLNRTVFDYDLAMRAVAAGAELFTETIGLQLTGNGLFRSLKTIGRNERTEEIRASIFIAADGVESKIARLVGIPNLFLLKEVEALLQYRLDSISLDPRTLEFHVGRQTAPSSYAWVFPKSENQANVGIGVSTGSFNGQQSEKYLKRFIEKRFGSARIVGRYCGLALRYQGEKIFRRKNLLVAGDAARTIDSLSGAGIINAMLSGKYAGAAAAEYLGGRLRQIDDIEKYYPGRFLDEKKDELILYRKLRNIYNKLDDDDFEDILEALNEFFTSSKTVFGLKAGQILAGLVRTRPKLLKYIRHLL
jgi:digeranylgeranylglycerophospholipid reductase